MTYWKYAYLWVIVFLPIKTIPALEDKEKNIKFVLEKLPIESEEFDLVSREVFRLIELVPNCLCNNFIALLDQMSQTFISQQIIHIAGENDATIAAPEAHRIIYENEYIRILESSLMPGQIVPFHTHQWDNLILTIQGSKFICNDGITLKEEEWFPSAEIVEGSCHAHSYQNIGTSVFLAVVFEFKS